MIRRHIPKGTDLNILKQRDVKRVEDWINNYPRKIFGYKSSEEMYNQELNALGISL